MKICPKCNIEFDPGKWNKAFCSRKCSNSRAFTSETNKKRSLANSRAYQRLSDDKKKEMIEKRLSTYRNHTPANLCICCKSLINKNKHNIIFLNNKKKSSRLNFSYFFYFFVVSAFFFS